MKRIEDRRKATTFPQAGNLLAAGIATVVLFGWALGLPRLTGFGRHIGSMAPSTALLFLLLGGAAFACARWPQSPAARRAGWGIGICTALVALVILILSFLGIRLEVESLGFPAAGSSGNMAQATAFLLLLTSLAFLLLHPPVAARSRRVLAAFGLSFIVSIFAYLLLLAYLFEMPVLYSKAELLPSLPTSLGFLAFGTGLLMQARNHTKQNETTNSAAIARIPYSLLMIFIVLALSIAALGYISYQDYEQSYRVQVEEQLTAIASLKVGEMENWRAERLGDAEVLAQNTAFSALVEGSFAPPPNEQAQAQLLSWLEAMRDAYQYSRIYLLDAEGTPRTSSPAMSVIIPEHLTGEMLAVLQTGEVTFLDFHRHTDNGQIYLLLLVPIYAGQGMDQPLGVLVMEIDPSIYLYPYLEQWPAPSETAETLLVRRDGQEVLYLNPLRFNPDAALTLRIPLTEPDILAVKAVLGETGIVEGTDYRGQAVVGYAGPVPGSPWFLVARMDQAEVYAPLRTRLWQTLIFFGMLIAVSGAGLVLVWRQQRVRYYRERYQSAEALSKSEEKFRLAFETSPDSVAITRMSDGMFVSVNKGFEQITGYTREQVIGKTSVEINLWKDPQDRRKIVEGLRAKGEVRNYEAPFLTRDGEIYGLMSAVIIELDGAPHILNITRDITERKQAEDVLRISEKNLIESQRIAHIGNWSLNVATNQVVWSEELYKIYGFDPALPPPPYTEHMKLFTPESWERLSTALANTRETGVPYELELETVIIDGSSGWMWVRGEAEVDPKGKIVGLWGAAQDITERKQAETALRESEQKYRLLFDEMSSGYAVHEIICDPGGKPVDYRFLSVNAAFEKMTGLHSADILGRTVLEVMPAIEPIWIERYGQVALTREPAQFENQASALGKTFEVRAFSPEAGKFATIFTDITERKQMEEALRESEDKFKYIFEYSVVGKSITQFNGGMQVNKALCEMLGYTPEEMQDKKWQEITHPDDIELTQKEIAALLSAKKESVRFAKRFIHKNGQIVWVDLSSTIRRDQNGQPLYLMTAVIDITERKQAEEKLIASEVRYRRLFEAAQDGILILDADTGVVVDVNPFLVEMLGFSHEAFIGKEIWELGFFKDIAANKAKFLELQRKDHIRYENLPMETADGRSIDVEFVGNVYQMEHRRVYQCNIRDITERKQAEEKILASEVRYRRLFEAARDGILILDADTGVVIDVNPFLVEMLGFSHEVFLGKELWELGFFKDIAANKENFLELQQKEYIRYEDLPMETADGRRINVEFVSNVYQVNHHKVVQCNIRDITERKRIEQQLAHYTEHLEEMVNERTHELRTTQEQLVRQERLAMLGQVAGSIGHELRNPLGVISNAVYYLKMSQPEANDTIREYLEIIEKETRISDKIVTDLLDFTRIRALDREPASVSDLVRQTLERYPVPPAIKVSLKIPKRLAQVYADPKHAVQILGNLVTNACQAMPEGGKLSISAGAPNGDMMKIEVHDTGMGIQPEHMEKLFEPLFTTKTTGIGLGLAVSRKLAESNGGRIEVQSEPGKGSTFTLYLPVHRS